MKKQMWGVNFLLVSVILSPVYANEQVFVRDYDYIATEYDSKYTAKIAAVDGLKSTLLDELGVYVQTEINIQQDSFGRSYMTKDMVQLTAGILSLKLLQERWNEVSYYVEGEMRANPNEVRQAVEKLRNDHQLEDALRYSLAEQNRLQQALLALRQQLAGQSNKHKPTDAQLAQYNQLAQSLNVEQLFQQAAQARLKGDFTQAFAQFKQLADNGNLKARARLGEMYKWGQGVMVDYAQALVLLDQAAEQGDARATAQLGHMYLRGMGVETDLARAFQLLTRAATKGSYLAKGILAQMYREGDFVKRDYAQAARLAEQAIEGQNGIGYSVLGLLNQQGLGMAVNHARAVELYQLGADRGNGRSMCHLGLMYAEGEGVKKDHNQAYSLVLAGYERGNPFCGATLGYLFEKGYGVNRDETKAFELYSAAGEAGGPYTMFRLAQAYHKGIGTKRDLNQAKIWYEKAAQKGHSGAARVLQKL